MESVPYLHPEAVRILESLLKPHFKVIEFGGGGSTVWLAERVAQVITYEKNPDWFAVLANCKLPNVTLKQAVHNAGDRDADMLIIDGEPVEARTKWLVHAIEIVKQGGWVVLDNCNRPEYEFQRNELQRRCEYFITFGSHPLGHNYTHTEFYKLR